MRRLSELIKETECYKCSKRGILSLQHVDIGNNAVTALVHCPECRVKDVLRFSLGDFGKVKADEVPEEVSNG